MGHAGGDHAGHRHALVEHGAEVAALDLFHGIEQELGAGVEGDLDRLVRLAYRDNPESQRLGAGRLVLCPLEPGQDGFVREGFRGVCRAGLRWDL